MCEICSLDLTHILGVQWAADTAVLGNHLVIWPPNPTYSCWVSSRVFGMTQPGFELTTIQSQGRHYNPRPLSWNIYYEYDLFWMVLKLWSSDLPRCMEKAADWKRSAFLCSLNLTDCLFEETIYIHLTQKYLSIDVVHCMSVLPSQIGLSFLIQIVSKLFKFTASSCLHKQPPHSQRWTEKINTKIHHVTQSHTRKTTTNQMNS